VSPTQYVLAVFAHRKVECQMKHMRNFIDGMNSIFGNFATSRPYIRYSGGFEADSRNLNNDVKRVAFDLKEQSELTYESVATRTGKKPKRR
jgi:hypothetical protein